MNRIDRLLAMVLVLQRHKLVRAEDLAARFAISKRTVYRDVAALSEMGVPVVAQPGEGYSLTEGYFLCSIPLATSWALCTTRTTWRS